MERWVLLRKGADFEAIGKKYQISPRLACLIRNRDVIGEEAVDRYLNGTISDLYDGMLMKDMDKAIDFFENTMGFKMVMKPELETDEMEAKGLGYLELQNVTSATAMFEMPSGQIIEALYYEYPKISDVTPTPLNYVGKHHVAYEVENMEEAHAELKKAGCEPLHKPLDDGNVCWEYMKNFEGTVFELTQE